MFSTDIQVRGYELDGYNHVNHAVYLNYAEHARWRMMEECSGGIHYFKNHGVAPVVVRVEADYREPCYLGEWVTVETRLLDYRTRTARFNHRVLKKDSGKLAADLIITLVVIDGTGKAVSIPDDFGPIFGEPATATPRAQK